MRTSKEERQFNAKCFFQEFVSGCSNRTAIVVEREDSKTNPNIHRCRFLAKVSNGLPVVISESVNQGISGCFEELIRSICGNVKQKKYCEEDFNSWLLLKLSCRMVYNDGFVIILER